MNLQRVSDVMQVRRAWQRTALRVLQPLADSREHREAMQDVSRTIMHHGPLMRPLHLATALYVYRDGYPQLAADLRPEHFVPYTSPGSNVTAYELDPAPDMAAHFWGRLCASAEDLFPQVHFSSKDTRDNISVIRRFLCGYRAAERLVVRGDHPAHADMHCGRSTNHLRRLFGAKGLLSHGVVCRRLLHREPEDLHALVAKLSGWAAVDGRTMLAVQQQLHREFQGDPFEPLSARLDARCRALSTGERAAMTNISVPHAVALVQLGTRYYLADVNSQQFGTHFDRLVFCPVEEAASLGYLLDYVQGSFHERARPYTRKAMKQHEQIRDEMWRQGTLF